MRSSLLQKGEGRAYYFSVLHKQKSGDLKRNKHTMKSRWDRLIAAFKVLTSIKIFAWLVFRLFTPGLVLLNYRVQSAWRIIYFTVTRSRI
jgi:hypothetical protein